MEKIITKWYFETSGFNYLLENIDFDSFLNTRELQRIKGRQLLISPITLWEVMLTKENSDFLIFSAQNLFDKNLLAMPSEIVTRYLQYAYPENKVNYPITTDLKIGELWANMTINNSIKFEYDIEKLKNKTLYLHKISKNLKSIINYTLNSNADATLKRISKVITVYHDCLKSDGFLKETKEYKEELIYKLVILFVLILFILKLDFKSNVIDLFWEKENIDTSNPTTMLSYFFEKYPLVLSKGPILEMAVMAYNQMNLGKTNRGLILDCFHMVYAPYVSYIVTADKGFEKLTQIESRYKNKIIHVSGLNFSTTLYLSKKD